MRDFSPQDLPRLRRSAYDFLRLNAVGAWEHQHGNDRWQIFMPPEIEALPARRRLRTHARQEAQRLADAALYDLSLEVTERATLLGAAIRENRHEEAVALAGRPTVVDTVGIRAPAASGFLRWRDPHGIGYNERGAPILACHWGPAAGKGRWLVWWSDTRAMARSYAAEADTRDMARILSTGLLPIFGPLWYDHQQLLRPHDATAPPPDPADADTEHDIDSSGVALIYTTLATWWLLTTPDTAVHLSQQPASAAEQAADRAAGLRPRPITVVTAANTVS
ncbi:hypothetical protein [Actinoallomurus sp. NPDC052274]|uniref:hypothetical protein n=1 Tax=Actinoallomurus sp. NPDC052274 TaxID=3155420 RepID=UPI003445798D